MNLTCYRCKELKITFLQVHLISLFIFRYMVQDNLLLKVCRSESRRYWLADTEFWTGYNSLILFYLLGA